MDGRLKKLWLAIIKNDAEVVREAIGEGADVNGLVPQFGARAPSVKVPVFFWALQKDLCILEYLIDAGADMCGKDAMGKSALHLEVYARGSREVVKKLVAAGANWLDRDNAGITPLAIAITTRRTYLLAGDQTLARRLDELASVAKEAA